MSPSLTPNSSGGDFCKEIYERHHTQISSYARFLCRKNFTDAEDLCQSFYLQLCIKCEQVKVGYHDIGLRYLLTMMKRYKTSEWRREQVYQQKLKEILPTIPKNTTQQSSSTSIYFEEFCKDLKKVLPDLDFQIFYHYLLGYTHKEIALKFNTTPNAIAVRIHRIKQKIREAFF